MKKQKSLFKALMAIVVAYFGVSLSNSNQVEAAVSEEINGGDKWICCQSMSDGCTDMDGNFWESDYKYYGITCGC